MPLMPNQTIHYFTSIIKRSHEFTDKEKKILLFRMKRMKLEKIGKKFHVSGERIRQMEKEILEKFEKAMVQLRLFD